jgi:hypothetical protein
MPQDQTATVMNNRRTENDDVAAFSGTVPVLRFSGVMLPHVVQPLRLRSEADRQTVGRTGSSGLVAIVPADVDRVPDVVCLARIASFAEPEVHPQVTQAGSEGGLVTLRGVIRGGLLSEDSRSGEDMIEVPVQALPDRYPAQPAIDRARRRMELLHQFYELFPNPSIRETLGVVLEDELPLGGLCDLLAYASQMTAAEAGEILNERNVDARTDLVLMALQRHLRRQRAEGIVFAPRFSAN